MHRIRVSVNQVYPFVFLYCTVYMEQVAFTLYSSGVKVHGGISGISVDEYLKSDF